LVKQGVAPDAKSAFELVRRSRDNPEATRASIFKSWVDAIKGDGMAGKTSEAIQKEAQQRTEETMKYLGGSDAAGNRDPESTIPTAPSDIKQLKVGQKYTSPKTGKVGTWTGSGWEVDD